jgi:PAS domain-containing protein
MHYGLIDRAEAFAPTKRIEREVAEVSGLLAMLAIGCSLMLAQLVSRPMKRLTGRALSLQKGDFDSPVPVEGPAEVRMFAQTFQAMALSLKNSRTALQESSERIRNILESISDGFVALDREWRCTYVNDKATELSRIPRAEILGKNVWCITKTAPGAPELRPDRLLREPVEVARAVCYRKNNPLATAFAEGLRFVNRTTTCPLRFHTRYCPLANPETARASNTLPFPSTMSTRSERPPP